MRARHVLQLIVLAALWGGSFIFMRVLAPVLGAATTACSRLLIAGFVVVGVVAVIGPRVEWRRHWKHYAVIGIVNSGIPFLLYAFAALHIPASYSAILNSTAPLFGMILGAVWLSARPSGLNLVGALLGMCGVGAMTGFGPVELGPESLLAIGACLCAALCYALAGIYMKKRSSHLNPVAVAGASQLLAGVFLVPGAMIWPPEGAITIRIVVMVLCLAIVCGAIGYLLYYRLVADCGPTRALTVTYLIPVFGVVWGAAFLDERITWPMVGGCGLVVVGTMLVIRKPKAVSVSTTKASVGAA